MENRNNPIDLDTFFENLFGKSVSAHTPKSEDPIIPAHTFKSFMSIGDAPTNAYIDKDNLIHIEIAMPGFNKEDIEVCINDNELTVSATCKMPEDVMFILKERPASFKRTFILAQKRSVGDFNIKYEEGILYIIFQKDVPKTENSNRITF